MHESTSESLCLTVARISGDALIFDSIPASTAFCAFIEQVATALDCDAGEVFLSQLASGGQLPGHHSSESSLSSLGFVDGLELTCVVAISEHTLDPRAFRMESTEENGALEDQVYADYISVYRRGRQTVAFAEEAAQAREARRQAIKMPEGSVHNFEIPNEDAHLYGRYEERRSTVDFANDIAASRRAMFAGVEDRDPWADYELGGRRSIEFAIMAASRREASFQSLIVDGPGICIGSKHRKAGDPEPDVRSDICSESVHIAHKADTEAQTVGKFSGAATAACLRDSALQQHEQVCAHEVMGNIEGGNLAVRGPELHGGDDIDDDGDDGSTGRDCSVLVCVVGSCMYQVGFAGDDAPTYVAPVVVGYPRVPSIMVANQPFYVGNSAHRHRGVLRLSYPINHGIVTNWDDMEKVWHHIFYNDVRVDPSECSVMITEPCLNPKSNRERIAEVMFETFNVQAISFLNSAVASCLNSGRSTALVLESGDGVSHVVPVYDGYLILNAVMRLDIAGRDITEYLGKMLKEERGFTCDTTAAVEILREIKEKLSYVAKCFDAEMLKGTAETDYILPDGSTLKVATERFRCAEIVFRPQLIGKTDSSGFPQALVASIKRMEIDIRRDFYSNILLSGGSTMLPGLPERLGQEIARMMPCSDRQLMVLAPSCRKYSAWVGGSIAAGPACLNGFLFRDGYDCFGSSAVQTAQPTGWFQRCPFQA